MTTTIIFFITMFVVGFTGLDIGRRREAKRTDAIISRTTFALYKFADAQAEIARRQAQGEQARLNPKAFRRYTYAESAATDLATTMADIIRERKGVSIKP